MLSAAVPHDFPVASSIRGRVSSLRGGPSPIRGGHSVQSELLAESILHSDADPITPSAVHPTGSPSALSLDEATIHTSNLSSLHADPPDMHSHGTLDSYDSIEHMLAMDDDFATVGINALIIDQIPPDLDMWTFDDALSMDDCDSQFSQLSSSSNVERSPCTKVMEVHSLATKHSPHGIHTTQAHLDTGSQASTTPHRHLLWNYTPFTPTDPCPIRLRAADAKYTHTPIGRGYLHVPADTPDGSVALLCYHTPEMPATIVSPRSFQTLLQPFYRGFLLHTDESTHEFTFTACHRLRQSQNISVRGTQEGGLSYTSPVLCPPTSLDDDYDPIAAAHADMSLSAALHVHRVSLGLDRLLWHQRLGHCSDEKLAHAHKYADGVPQFSSTKSVLDNCPVCLAAKTRHQPRGDTDTRATATRPFQGLSLDFSFAGQASKDATRGESYTGFNGETCYILIADHHTEELFGSPRVSKAAPIEYLRLWLRTHVSGTPPTGRYVMMDQGGELYKNPAIRKLFTSFGFALHPTATEAHHANGVIERANRTVDAGIRNLLHGANLPVRFWPYAFHFFLHIKNAALPRRGAEQCAYTKSRGLRPNLQRLRTFGCRVWVKAPGTKRRIKYIADARKGVNLGFLPGSTKSIVWYDPATDRIKYAYHCRFDEGMNDLTAEELPPNVKFLQRSHTAHTRVPAADNSDTPVDFNTSPHPFFSNKDVTVTVRCSDPTYGFVLGQDDLLLRAYIKSIPNTKRSSATSIASTPRAARGKYTGAYITAIEDTAIFTVDQALNAFQSLRDADTTQFTLTLALEPALNSTQLRKHIDDLDYSIPADSDDPDPDPDPASSATLPVFADNFAADTEDAAPIITPLPANKCIHCKETFVSRNALFRHLRQSPCNPGLPPPTAAATPRSRSSTLPSLPSLDLPPLPASPASPRRKSILVPSSSPAPFTPDLHDSTLPLSPMSLGLAAPLLAGLAPMLLSSWTTIPTMIF